MPLSSISMIPSRPHVKRVGRQKLLSIYGGTNSSRGPSSTSHTQQDRIFSKPENSWMKTKESPKIIEQRQKQQLFRRVCFFLSGAILLVLILAAIGASILALIRSLQANTSSQNTDTNNTTTNFSVVSTASSSSTNVTISSITMPSTTTTTSTNIILRWNSTGATVAGTTGLAGPDANQLDHPFSLALDSSNTLYIADQQNNRIQKWLMGASNGTTVAGDSSGTLGITLSDLNQPSGVLLDSSSNIYVTDTSNNRVQFWSNGTSSGTTVAGILGSTGSGNNVLTDPYGIARDSNSGTLYIVDQSNHRVMSYLSGASSGTVVAGGNGQGVANTQLNLPVGVYFDSSSNSLFIANAGGNNVVKWILGASNWTLVAGSVSGASGNTSTLLNYPMGVTLDSMRNVYVADRDNHRIQLFVTGQSNGTTIAGVTGKSGTNSTLLFKPCSVALDTQLNLYVADTYNGRVQKFIHN